MERIKVALPGQFLFSASIPVRITDMNYGNHMGNDVFLSMIQEARMQFLQSHGYSELAFAGVGLIMADAAIEFKTEILYGDTVKIEVMATGFDRSGFDLFYQMKIVREGKEILAGKAKTGMICYDYDLKKIVVVPKVARIKLEGPGMNGTSRDE